MEEFKSWGSRFGDWVKNEPVRAAESVRMVLFGVTAVFAVADEATLTAVSGAVTGAFSIWSSRSVRKNVSPVAKLEKAPTVDPDDIPV